MRLLPAFIKVVIAILLLICLLDISYEFFKIIRFTVLIGFLYLTFNSFRKKDLLATLIYFSLALIYQPFLIFAFENIVWIIINIVTALGLLFIDSEKISVASINRAYDISEAKIKQRKKIKDNSLKHVAEHLQKQFPNMDWKADDYEEN